MIKLLVRNTCSANSDSSSNNNNYNNNNNNEYAEFWIPPDAYGMKKLFWCTAVAFSLLACSALLIEPRTALRPPAILHIAVMNTVLLWYCSCSILVVLVLVLVVAQNVPVGLKQTTGILNTVKPNTDAIALNWGVYGGIRAGHARMESGSCDWLRWSILFVLCTPKTPPCQHMSCPEADYSSVPQGTLRAW